MKKNTIIARILILAIISIMFTGCNKTSETAVSDDNIVEDKDIKVESNKQGSYLGETSYTEGEYTDALFEYPFFVEGEDSIYISNKELVSSNSLKDDRFNAMVGLIADYNTIIYGNNYRTIRDDREGFIDSFMKYYPESDATIRIEDPDQFIGDDNYNVEYNSDEDVFFIHYDPKNMAIALADWYEDNEIYAECNIETDRCLVWKVNGYYAIRCALHVTFNSSNINDNTFDWIKNNMLKKENNYLIQNNKEFVIITDFIFDNDYSFLSSYVWDIVEPD